MSASQSKEVDFSSLKFIRVFTPMHVPKELIEQVKDREYEVDDWFAYQEAICVRQTNEGLQLNPLSMLYVVADEGNKVVGVLWCEVEALAKVLVIQTFSMDKKYWVRGKAVELLAKKAKEIAKECKLKKIMWLNNYPRHSERHGFKRSKLVIMEWCEGDDEPKNEVKLSKDERECNSKDDDLS
jgi:N-acetylglutamate synthase-like GNAT family acetyltransferase